MYDTEAPAKYIVKTDLSSRVGNLNPHWNETLSNEGIDARFELAMALTGAEFVDAVAYYGKATITKRA